MIAATYGNVATTPSTRPFRGALRPKFLAVLLVCLTSCPQEGLFLGAPNYLSLTVTDWVRSVKSGAMPIVSSVAASSSSFLPRKERCCFLASITLEYGLRGSHAVTEVIASRRGRGDNVASMAWGA